MGSPEPPNAEINIEVLVQSDDWRKLLPRAGDFCEKACKAAIDATDIKNYGAGCSLEVSIMLTDDDTIRNLNRDFRAKDKPTNVLAFPCLSINPDEMDELQFVKGQVTLLGDIIISGQTVQKEAKDQGKPFADHVAHLVVHGCLHLLGYNHEEEQDANVMEPLEIKILSDLGIKNPYEDGELIKL